MYQNILMHVSTSEPNARIFPPNERSERSPYHTPKAKWSQEEDDRLRAIVRKYGAQNWPKIALEMPGRNGKQCRERWITNLSPEVNTADWSSLEDQKLFELHTSYGNKWSKIAAHMPGRTPIGVKNRWNFLLRRDTPTTSNIDTLASTPSRRSRVKKLRTVTTKLQHKDMDIFQNFTFMTDEEQTFNLVIDSDSIDICSIY